MKEYLRVFRHTRGGIKSFIVININSRKRISFSWEGGGRGLGGGGISSVFRLNENQFKFFYTFSIFFSEYSMEQPANERNINAECINIERRRLSEEPKIVALISLTAAVGINSTEEKNEIAEHIEHSTEPSESLETINNDCLLEIVKYLDIMDIVNLARASERLYNFAKDEIFPKAVKETYIYWYYNMDDGYLDKISLTTYGGMEVELTRENLETAFRFFGEFVEDLQTDTVMALISNKTHITENILKSCHNLKKLHLKHYIFSFQETQELQNNIERLQHLNELTITDCHDIITHWRASNGILNVKKLILGHTLDDVNCHFVGCFRNLTSLSLDLMLNYWQRCHGSPSPWKLDDFVEMFDNNRHSLKHLKVRSITENSTPENAARILNDRLPCLEYLELNFALTDETTCFIDMPQLKSVKLGCTDAHRINSALRKLSVNGIVEELLIFGGVFEESLGNVQPPLRFLKLRTFIWKSVNYMRFSGILQTLSRSLMPEIQFIEFAGIKTNDLDDLSDFIESKKTLKMVELNLFQGNAPLSFWRKLVGILKESSTPRRSLLSITITKTVTVSEEVVST